MLGGALSYVQPTPAYAQGERLGAVAGTWAACAEKLQPLETRLKAEEDKNTHSTWLKYLKRRYAVELDQCTQLADAPLVRVVEVIGAYQELEIDARALDITLEAMERYGKTTALHLAAGQLMYRKGFVDQALVHLRTVIDADSKNVPANQLLAAYYYSKGDVKVAIPHLRVVANALENQFEPNAALGDACLTVDDLKCASTYLNRASRLKPDDLLLAIRVGDLSRKAGQPGEAIEAYERVLDQEPKRFEAVLGLGRVFVDAELWENAQVTLARAADLKPENPQPAVEASRVSRRLNRAPLGVALTRRVIHSGARSAVIDTEHALALLASGSVPAARTHLESLPAGFKNDDRVIAVHGDVDLAQGKFAKALTRYRAARQARPHAIPYVVRHARVLRKMGSPRESVAILEPFHQQSPAATREYAEALLELARVEAAAGHFKKALRSLEQALAIRPDNARLQLSRIAIVEVLPPGEKAENDLASLPESHQKTLTTAWQAYQRGSSEAVTVTQSVYEKHPSPETRALWLAALVQAKHYRKVYTMELGAAHDLVDAWRGAALGKATQAAIKKRRYAEVAELGQVKHRAPRAMAAWLERAQMVQLLATGSPKAERSIAPWAKRKNEGLDGLDLALKSAAYILKGSQEKALKTLQKAPPTDAFAELAAYAHIDAARRSFERGKFTEAKRHVEKITSRKTLSAQAKMNVVVIRRAKQWNELLKSLKPYEALPEALWNMAVAAENVGDSQRALQLMEQAAQKEGKSPAVAKAQAMLGLKRRLYR